MTLSSEAVELFSEHHGIHFSLQGLAQEWGVAGAAAERFIRDGRFSFRVKHHQIGRSPFFQGDGGQPHQPAGSIAAGAHHRLPGHFSRFHQILVNSGQERIQRNHALRGDNEILKFGKRRAGRVIGNNAFKNCKALTTVKMENNVETIGYSSFMNCKKLKSIVIPETVKEINDGAFRNCKKLATVKMKTKQLKIIDDNVFYGCKALKSIVIPEEVTEIGDNTFKGCQSLKKVSMDTCKLSLIGDNAFNGCKKLTSFDIPDAVKRIGDRAFYNCKSLKNIMIASTKLSSKRVGSEAFKGISRKSTVKVSPKKMKSYRKLLKAKGLPKTAKVSKWMPAASAKHKM